MRSVVQWEFYREDVSAAALASSPPLQGQGPWRDVGTVHDFAIEDVKRSAGVIALRNGTWKFRAGDDRTWAVSSLEDRDWQNVTVPANWHTYGVELPTEFAWFRRRFHSSAVQRKLDESGHLRLALGPIADADETFVNGVRVGRTGLFPADEAALQAWEPRLTPRSKGVCADALQYRVYKLPARSLRGGDEVVAVRVFAAARRRAQPWPCGLVDPPGGGDRLSGPFDPASSEGQLATGFTVGGVGWYRTSLPLAVAEAQAVASGRMLLSLHFDGVYGQAEAWMNGKLLLHSATDAHPLASLAPFGWRVDGEAVHADGPSQLTVRVDARGVSSRWYTGAGILRPVTLLLQPHLHIEPEGGVRVRTISISGVRRLGRRAQTARLGVLVRIRNAGATTLSGSVRVTVERRRQLAKVHRR